MAVYSLAKCCNHWLEVYMLLLRWYGLWNNDLFISLFPRHGFIPLLVLFHCNCRAACICRRHNLPVNFAVGNNILCTLNVIMVLVIKQFVTFALSTATDQPAVCMPISQQS